MQVTAREKELPLDSICLRTFVTNSKDVGDFPEFAEQGAYIYGMFLQGAAWEMGRGLGEQGYLTDMVLKELHPEVPILHITAIMNAEKDTVGFYECPVYVTSQRGPTFVFCANLAMESEEQTTKWILGGCAMLMSPE